MSIAPTIEGALRRESVEFAVLRHPRTATSRGTADAAHVSAEKVAKGVLLKDGQGHVLVVLSAAKQLPIETLARELHRPLRLASEDEVATLFFDCDPGAVPALGEEYQVPTIVDAALLAQDEVYFEAGNHEELVRVRGPAFARLMAESESLPLGSG